MEKDKELRQRRNRLATYRPYLKQAEFHAAGATYRERLLMAGNQLGKTLGAGFETAMHLTGIYPDWWVGRRFDKPVVGWASGVTGESTRDNPQRILIGRTGEFGTGTIPSAAVLDYKAAPHSAADSLDHIKVRHISGETSFVYFKSYEKGREKWQGETLDFVWFDEEPPSDIYSEGLTRTNATGGIAYVTFTPLLGISDVVRKFLIEKSPGTHITQMTIEDAEHYTPEQRASIIASYPEHEREARSKGIPILGSGRIFPVSEDLLKFEPFDIPKEWVRIGGMDFGWDHPFAAVELVWDRDSDRVYVTKAYRRREAAPILHAGALKPWGAWLPWSWPRDGHRETLEGAGIALAQQFGEHGLNMLPEHAQFESGSVSVEAGLMEMLDRMETGRFKVASHLAEWWEEFRLYHRKDGKVVKEGDDLMSATRYALMMLRFATVNQANDIKFKTDWIV